MGQIVSKSVPTAPVKWVQIRDERGTETRTPATTTTLTYDGRAAKKTCRTFLMHQHLKLILHVDIPQWNENVKGVVAANFLVRRLLPAFKRFKQAVPRLRGHVVD